jgi:hypothetical protein
MATRKNQKKKKKSTSNRRAQAGQAHRRKRDGKAAAKGMLTGASILAAIAILAFLRIGGDTPLNHLINLFSGDDGAVSDTSSAKPAKAKPSAKPTGIQSNSAPKKRRSVTRPSQAKPAISRNATKAPPLEKLSDGDKAGLDELIKAKGK